MLERTLESPLASKEIKLVNCKGNQAEHSLEGLLLKLQYIGHLMWSSDSLEKTLILGKIEGKRRKGQQRTKWLDSVIDSMDMNLRKLHEIAEDRETGMLQSTWSQRVRHDLATKQLQWDYWASQWLSGKESTCSAGDAGSVPTVGRSSGEGNGNPLQYSCLWNFMDRAAC